jgi:hypothetical protein
MISAVIVMKSSNDGLCERWSIGRWKVEGKGLIVVRWVGAGSLSKMERKTEAGRFGRSGRFQPM